MLNHKCECIFDHEGFLYVCNFKTMTMWIIYEEDEADPITTLEIARDSQGAWSYRISGSDADFTQDSDRDMVAKLEKYYERYLNIVIVGKDARLQRNSPSEN